VVYRARLVILQIEPQSYEDDYVKFPTDGGFLSLFSFKAHEELAKDSTIPSSNRCVELEFNVDNVDNQYLVEVYIEWEN
jgi:hypothetical protein